MLWSCGTTTCTPPSSEQVAPMPSSAVKPMRLKRPSPGTFLAPAAGGYGVTTVPSARRTLSKVLVGCSGWGNLAAISSSMSIPSPGLPFDHM